MQKLLQLNLNCNIEGKLKIIQSNLQINLKIISSIVKHVSTFFSFYINKTIYRRWKDLLKRSIILFIGKSSGLFKDSIAITREKELIIDYSESFSQIGHKNTFVTNWKKPVKRRHFLCLRGKKNKYNSLLVPFVKASNT